MEVFFEVFKAIGEAMREMWSIFFEFFIKAVHVSVWALLGIIVLPAVYIANHFFPKWVKWGEDF